MRRVPRQGGEWLVSGLRPPVRHPAPPASSSATAGVGGHARSQRDRVAGRGRCHAAREMPALPDTSAREPRLLFSENRLRPSAAVRQKL
jgi:hypothetical protein